MFGIPLEGPTNIFCDNKSVLTNTTKPESTLKHKHNSIAYHRVREAAAADKTTAAKRSSSKNVGRKIFPYLNMNMINYCIRKTKMKRVTVADILPMIITVRSQNSELSSLTVKHHPINAGAIALLSLSSNLGSTFTTECTSENVSVQKQSTAGRPKGTTDSAAIDLRERIESATKEAAERLKLYHKTIRHRKNQKFPKGSLNKLIESAKQKYEVPEDVEICKETIR
jgi:hypothetical protein